MALHCALFFLKKGMVNIMHKALYRKWRPMLFDDVYGQEHITSVLKYQIKSGKISHAYLFCGSRGTGKTTCAKILARAVNCEEPVNGNPCGKCSSCTGIENNSVTDVIEMDAASNNGVEDVRSIRDDVIYSPSSVKYRVYIIDEVHMLSVSAFNALLKTLEEPPPHVIFILATTELQKLPATIISRCQRFDFRRISIPVISKRLEYIAFNENIKIDKDACELIAKLAQGGMRDAISLLELCAGEAGGKTDAEITADIVEQTAGIAGREITAKMVSSIIDGNIEASYDIIAQLYNSSRDIGIFWQDLMAFFRDILVIKACKDSKKYLDLTENEYDETAKIAKNVRREKISFYLGVMDKTILDMQHSGMSKRICAELAIAKMTDPSLAGKDSDTDALSERIAKLEDSLNSIQSTLIHNTFDSYIADDVVTSETADNKTQPADKSKPSLNFNSRHEIKGLNTDKNIPYTAQNSPSVKTPGTDAESQPRTLYTVGYWSEIISDYDRYDKTKTELLRMTKAYRTADGLLVIKTDENFIHMMLDNSEVRSKILTCASKYDKEINDILIEKNDTSATDSDLIDELKKAAEESTDTEKQHR